MRGLTKVAALLSSTWVAAFAIPPTQQSGGIIAYTPSDASLQFVLLERHPIFEFSVSNTDKPCGETNVKLNGQSLESEWRGKEAHGRGFLDIYSQHEAIWSITCLYSSTSSDGSFPDEENVVHLFRLRFEETTEGFTVSYRQAKEATIVRFSPYTITKAEVNSNAREWRQPSVDFDQDLLMNPQIEDEKKILSQSFWHGTQNFLSSVSAFKGRLKETLLSITGCHKHQAHIPQSHPSPLTVIPYLPVGDGTKSGTEDSYTPKASDSSTLDNLRDPEENDSEAFKIENDTPNEHQVSSATSQRLDSTSTLLHHSAAETRSLQTPEDLAYSSPTIVPSSTTFAPHPELNYRGLKIFGLILILLSLFVWCLLRCKDPRWRAERAARHEEQRTKRLYKLAARKHKIKTFFGNIRMRLSKIKLAGAMAFVWDEKQAEASEVEESSESAVGNANWSPQITHRVTSNIAAAEEGRNDFEYDAESSQRRRSVSTLPGYESDGGQLPPYEAHRSFGISNSVNGVAFASADIDSNPDSSVVSTSPRFSRDGTNSDFDEKFEALSLDQSFRIDQCH